MRNILFNCFKISPLALVTYACCATQTERQDKYQTGFKNFKGFKNRQQHLKDVTNQPNYDIIVIGGGASGAGVCLDASTRGLRTLIIEKNDFGSGSSSKSTKLIHGGVRYLQQVFKLSLESMRNRIQKFKLVTQAIKQRGVLLRNASYMNDKIPFVIPTTSSFASIYYYVGSVVYYLIYWFASEKKNKIKFNFPYFLHRGQLRQIFPLISDKFQGGIVYEDGCFNDTRLLLTTLLTTTLSKQQYRYLPEGHSPSNIINKAQFKDFIKNKDGVIQGVIFEDTLTGKVFRVKAKYFVNCTGVWADKIRLKDNPNAIKRICIVGGSHITYDSRLASNKFGLCLPSIDGRVLLVVPWLNRVIAGTTQKVFQQPVSNPTISLQQRRFIQDQMIQTMDKISAADFIDFQKSRWTGLRPLVLSQQAKNTKDITRTHVVQRSSSGLYSLMGGKWTTYRKMGQDLIDQVSKQQLKKNGKKFNPSVSQNVLLVGSCSPLLQQKLKNEHGELGLYLYKTYGSLATQILKGDLSPVYGNITKAQIDYIIKNQLVNQVEDILLRRLRVAFLYQKQKTLPIIPFLSQQILNANNFKGSQNQIDKYIKKNIQTICSYEFD